MQPTQQFIIQIRKISLNLLQHISRFLIFQTFYFIFVLNSIIQFLNMDKENKTPIVDRLATNFNLYKARNSQSIYLQVVSKNFQIIRSFMAKFNILYTKHEIFQSKLEEYFKRLQKVQRDQMNIHHQFRTARQILEMKGPKAMQNQLITQKAKEKRGNNKVPSLLGFLQIPQDEQNIQDPKDYNSMEQQQIQINGCQKLNTKSVKFNQDKNVENDLTDDNQANLKGNSTIEQNINNATQNQFKQGQASNSDEKLKSLLKGRPKYILEDRERISSKKDCRLESIKQQIVTIDQQHKNKLQKLQNDVNQCFNQIKQINANIYELNNRLKQNQLETHQFKQITINQNLYQKTTQTKLKDLMKQLEEINTRMQRNQDTQECAQPLGQLKNQISYIKTDKKLILGQPNLTNQFKQTDLRRSFSSKKGVSEMPKARNSVSAIKNRKYNAQSQRAEKVSVTLKQWTSKVKHALNKKPLFARKID